VSLFWLKELVALRDNRASYNNHAVQDFLCEFVRRLLWAAKVGRAGQRAKTVATRLSPEEMQEVKAACIGWRRRRWRIAGSAHSKPTSKRPGFTTSRIERSVFDGK
jgi:hypothetical protein